MGVWQSSPSHPLSQRHLSTSTQTPWPEQFPVLPEQIGFMQSNPVHPFEHRQTPGDMHSPWTSQPSAQMGTSHVAPVQPSKQTHLLGNLGGKLASANGRVILLGSTVPMDPTRPSELKSRSTPFPTLKPSLETVVDGTFGSESTGSVTTATSPPKPVISTKETGSVILGSEGKTLTPVIFGKGISNGYTVSSGDL